MSDQPLDYDTVAFALLNAFSRGEMEDEKDNSLAIFLGKLYKNNTSPRSKRMNSIRLNRFNAFLYRVNSPLPNDHKVCRVVHASLLAVLANNRNFEEEEDEEVLISIARWACQIMENTVQTGFHDLALNSLRYLLRQDLGPSALPSPSDFEDLLKECDFFSTLELCAEDERKAFLESLTCSITSNFSLSDYILENLSLKHFYGQLFKISNQGKEVIELFGLHLKKLPFHCQTTQLFAQTFLSDPMLVREHLGLLLKSLDQHCKSIDGLRSAISKILQFGVSLQSVFKIEPSGSKTEELLLEMLKERYGGNKIAEVIEAFLTGPVSNLIAPCLLANSDSVPEESLNLLFSDGDFSQKQAIVTAFALVHHHSGKLPSKLMTLWEESNRELSPERNSLIVRALYCSLCETDKSTMFAKIASSLNTTTINGPALPSTIPLGSLKPEKLNLEDKNLLAQILSEGKTQQDCLPQKIELLGLCGQNVEMTKKIKYLQELFSLSAEEILKSLSKEPVSKDPVLLAAVLMGLNNRMEITFIEEPDEKALDFLARYYTEWDFKFGHKLGQLINEKPHSPMSYYLWCLSRFNIQTGNFLSGFPEPLNTLLNGDRKYSRLVESDFSGYFYRQQNSVSLVGQLSTEKKILMEIRKMLRKLFRKDKNLSENLKDVQGLLGNEWSHVLAVKLVHAYFQAVIDNPAALKQVISKLVPEFGFFQRIFTLFQTQSEEYVDFLTYLPKLLQVIYPEALEFMARLIDSQPGNKKQKEKKKTKKKKNQQKNIVSNGLEDGNIILDIGSLFQYFRKTKSLGSLFGDPSHLQSFDQLFQILVKLPKEDTEGLKPLIEGWLEMICIFHPQKDEELKWRNRVLSYCRIWKTIFFDLSIQVNIETLCRHFDILAELLNMHYESKVESPQLQEQLLMTLLLVLQAGQSNSIIEQDNIPIESIRNCLLGYRLPIPYEQHFFLCHTCNLSVCQVCAPFLHKHHDLSYTAKDGNCVHDSSQKKTAPGQPERNIFTGQSRPRRQQDLFALNFDLGEDEMEYSEQMRFRELMEYRLHEQQRERERESIMREKLQRRDRSRSRERENIFIKKSNDIVNEAIQQPEEISQKDILNEIKSENSKSICNIEKGFRSEFMFQPQFAPTEDQPHLFTSQIDARPLRNILMRELQQSVHSEAEKGRSKGELSKQRYNFFKQSAYFKTSRGDYGGLMRGLSQVQISKRNLLTANKKFMAFPSASNGILMMSVAVLGMKLQRRQANKAMSEYEQQRTYISNAINNSNLAFEPFELLFGRSGLLAVIGASQLGFFILSPDGKVQKFVQSDIKCGQPITKFQWVGKQKSNVFSLSYGNCIRMGSVAEDLRVRTSHRLKIQIDNVIKDFQMSLQNHSMTVYILDTDGGLYRGEFDFRQTRAVNISDKKIENKEMGNLSSMLLFGKKLLVSATNGKLHLLKVDGRSGQFSLLQTFDLESILKSLETKLKGNYVLFHPKLIQSSDSVTSICCLLNKIGEGRKKGNSLAILRLTGNSNDLDMVILSEDETVEHFEVLELGENNFAIVAVEENGTVWVSPYSVSNQLLSQREESKLPITEQSITAVNQIVKQQRLLSMARCCQPRRCDTYKETKQITTTYSTTVEHEKITIRANSPGKYFIAGFSLFVDSADSAQISFIIQGEERRCKLQKGRELQLGLSLKQTLQCFVEDCQVVVNYRILSGAPLIKGMKIYGVDFSQESAYKNSYSQLHRLISIHFLYDETSLIHYLQNPEKNGLPKCNLTELDKIKSNYKYSHKEITLLMKLELLRVSTNKGLKSEELEEMLLFVRGDLLPQSEKRHFLEKSCWRLMKQLCYLILPEGRGRVGHPFEFRTSLDLYYYEKSYCLWSGSKQLSSFQKLVTFLNSLIFKRISNLYLILRLHPNLIYELTFFYKNALHCLKQSGDQTEQLELAKLINICPSYVALVCEYYQTLKNVSQDQMVDQKEICPEKVVLDLLEEVFCATKKELYREIFVSPELYLDRLYLTKRKPLFLSTSVDIFGVKQEGQTSDHASRKASIGQQEVIQSEEQELQLEEDSEKEMLEEQAREMPEISQSQIPQLQVKPQPQHELPRGLKKLTGVLSSYLLPNDKKVSFTYYQFSFQMLTALFKLEGYLTKQNAVFYLGFAFNLLRILEFNTHSERDKEYLNDFFAAVIEAVQKESHSILFLVLNYFLEPICGEKTQQGVRDLKGSRSRLGRYFVDYLLESKTDIEALLTGLKVTKISQPVTMTKAMRFVNFELENQSYQLKFLGNLFVLLRSSQHPQLMTPSNKLKDFVLSTVIRHKLRVFNNIMVSEQWGQQLEEAKIEVGFGAIKENPQEGINIIYDCAIKKQEVFVKKLAACSDYIARLEDLLGTKGIKEEPVLEMLNIYYGSQ